MSTSECPKCRGLGWFVHPMSEVEKTCGCAAGAKFVKDDPIAKAIDIADHRSNGWRDAEQARVTCAQLRASHALLLRLGKAQRAADAAAQRGRDAIRDGGYVDGYLLASADSINKLADERDAARKAVIEHALSLAAASPAQAVDR